MMTSRCRGPTSGLQNERFSGRVTVQRHVALQTIWSASLPLIPSSEIPVCRSHTIFFVVQYQTPILFSEPKPCPTSCQTTRTSNNRLTSSPRGNSSLYGRHGISAFEWTLLGARYDGSIAKFESDGSKSYEWKFHVGAHAKPYRFEIWTHCDCVRVIEQGLSGGDDAIKII